jgi:glycine/D-amino acid oxidase-like deaminating enzyme
MKKKHVIVIGSGIIGASIACHLARAGADVALLESGLETGGIATPASWAWINASWGNDHDYTALRMQSMQQWRSLDKALPGLNVQWKGSILWDLPEEKLLSFAAEHASWGYPARIVTRAEVAELEPHLKVIPSIAVHVATEGAIEPAHAADCFVTAARSAGADIIVNAHVKYINFEKGRVTGVTTHEETLHTDEVVIAAGVNSVALLKSLGMVLRLDQPAGLLVHTKPASEMLNGVVLTPKLHVRQSPEGRLVAGSDFGETDPTEEPEAAANKILNDLKALLEGGESIALERYTIGNRPTPADGFPLLGRPRSVPGLYLAVTHSGITLAPVIGSIVADEILNDRRALSLARYLPDRALS